MCPIELTIENVFKYVEGAVNQSDAEIIPNRSEYRSY